MFENREPQFFKTEKPLGQGAEVKKEQIENLQGFIKETSLNLKKEGVPVDENGRLDMGQFEEAYPRRIIEADKSWVKDLREKGARAKISESPWSWALPREKILEQKTLGEAWEMLATAVLHKNLGSDFIVTRSSEYDDFRNGVDNIIIDKKSGNIVCAFDEVGAISGRIFDDKKNEVLKKNSNRGGADMAYGISFKEIQGKRQLKKGRINHIPLFYFPCPEETVKRGLNNFSKTGASQVEQEIFKGFINLLFGQGKEKGQIELLKGLPLHPKLRQRLETSEEILKRFKDVVK